MLVDEWVVTLWSILNVRDKTIRDYKHLYKRHLQPLIGSIEINLVTSKDLQVKLLSLPPQTARHTLMVAKTIWREAENYGVATSNPLTKIKTAPIQVTKKKFLTWDEVNSLHSRVSRIRLYLLIRSEVFDFYKADFSKLS